MSETQEEDFYPDQETVLDPADRPKQTKSKKGSWIMSGVKGKSDKRVLYAMAAAVLLAGGAFLVLGGGNAGKSALPQAPGQLNNTQGTAVPTPAYRSMINEQNRQRADEAAKTGGSALPTVVFNGNPAPTKPATKKVRPTHSTKGSAAILPDAPAGAGGSGEVNSNNNNQTGQAATTSNYVPVTQQRVAAMVKEIQSLDTESANNPLVVEYTQTKRSTSNQASNIPYNRAYMSQNNHDSAQNSSSNLEADKPRAPPQPSGPFSVPAPGTKLYSVMDGMDSNAPGPITGRILQGRLAGARLIGSAQTTPSGAAVIFTSMTVPYHNSDGVLKTQTIPIHAYAISTKNGTTDVATSVNNHLVTELAVNFLSSLAGNFGQLLASSGASTVLSPTGGIGITNPTLSTEQEIGSAAGTAIGSAGQTFSQIYGNRPTTIKIAKGTPFILLFVGSGAN